MAKLKDTDDEQHIELAFSTKFNVEYDKQPDETPHILTFNSVNVGVLTFATEVKDKDKRYILKGFSYNGIKDFLTANGFYYRHRETDEIKRDVAENPIFIRDKNGVIFEVLPVGIKDFITTYFDTLVDEIPYKITEKDTSVIKSDHIRELWKRQAENFCSIRYLEHLEEHTKPIITDTIDTTYKFYKNVAIRITKDGKELLQYNEFEGKCIWRGRIIQREFKNLENSNGGYFGDFLSNITNEEEDRFLSLKTGIGYLLNSHNAQSQGQAVMCYDEVIVDLNSPSGGTGKGLFTKGLGQIADVCVVDGKKYDANDRFCFQRYRDSTELIIIDDIKPTTPFSRFHSLLTEGLSIEKKHKPEQFVPAEKSPKFVFTSNAIADAEGTTNSRRQFDIEFSDFYSKKIRSGIMKPIQTEFNCILFGDDFPKEQWILFDNFMIDCCQYYLKFGLIYHKPKNKHKNRLRQKTNEDFAEWILDKDLQPEVQYNAKVLYEEFKQLFYTGDDKFKLGMFTKLIRLYSSIFGLSYKRITSNNNVFFILQSLDSTEKYEN